MGVVVTGATGHVGANLVRALGERGQEVRVLVRKDQRALDGVRAERVAGDVTDPASLVAAFQGADVVFHLAAQISIVGGMGGLVRRVNVDGVRNVTAACRAAGVRRLVHFSSIHAFTQTPVDDPLDETRVLVEGPSALAYDLSKADGIRVVRDAVDAGLDAVIVCPTAVLGPFDFKGSRMGRILVKLASRGLIGLVDGGFDWVDARDVCAGALAAAEKGRTGELYLLGGAWAPVTAVAKHVQELTGVPAPWFVTPMWMARMAAPFSEGWARLTGTEPLFTSEALVALRANRDVRHDKAERELGYAPRPLRDTIRDALDWWRAAGEPLPAAAEARP